MNSATADAAITRWTGDAMQSRLRKRYRSERLFKLLGFGAVGMSLAFLAFLLGTMLWQGAGGLTPGFPAGFGFDRPGDGRRVGSARRAASSRSS